jgi:hypothetical protein
MSLDDIVSKITDPYERKARTYPALLVLLPAFTVAIAIYGPKASVVSAVATTAVSCGGLYWMAETSRRLGHELESKLYDEWGGKPSTQLLRHRDRRIEKPTKQRYHSFLAARINVPFPTAEQESQDPAGADEVYQSGVRWLLNHTRPNGDKNFDLLLKENIGYGFRRNLLGLKKLGILIAVVSAIWALGYAGVVNVAGRPVVDVTAIPQIGPNVVLSLVVSLGMIIFWVFSATKASVRFAAFGYAEMLLRACDILEEAKVSATDPSA